MHNVSLMKYLPDRNFTEKTRYKSFGVGLGYGKRFNNPCDSMKNIFGPGKYNLPFLFEKRIQKKYPVNWGSENEFKFLIIFFSFLL